MPFGSTFDDDDYPQFLVLGQTAILFHHLSSQQRFDTCIYMTRPMFVLFHYSYVTMYNKK